MIQSARRDAFELAGKRQMDGFLLKKIDEDAHRLAERAKGKLYGTRLRLAERDTEKSPYRSISRQQTNAQVIASFMRQQKGQVVTA